MIFDAFTYYNEIDLLRVRLVEHEPFVNQFVIAEGDRTFVGAAKQSFLDLNDPRIAPFRSRITLIRVPLSDKPKSAWDNELAQRNSLLASVEYRNDDVILVSDVDEIVCRSHWPQLLSRISQTDIVPVRCCVCYYNINLTSPEEWTRPKLVRFGPVQRTSATADSIRMREMPCPPETIGFHFSYIGDTQFVQQKLINFSHQEYNTAAYNSAEHISSAIAKGVDLFGRFGKFYWVPVSRRWPVEMRANPIWQRFICPPPSTRDWLAGHFGRRRRRLP